MEDLLEMYEKPRNRQEPVVCLDEKPVSLHADVRAPLPPQPGQIAKRDNEYQRCGTANVFCAVEPQGGRHFTKPTPDRTGAEFAKMVGEIERSYPQAQTIHLVMDNLNIHQRKSLTDHFGDEEGGRIGGRFTVHYTPKHGSWLNQAEIEISVYARQCLGKRRIPDLAMLKQETRAWNRHRNRTRATINWKFTRTAAREKFGYSCNSIKKSED